MATAQQNDTGELAAAIVLLAEKMGANQNQVAATLDQLQQNAPKREIKEGDPEYTARQKAEGFYDEFDGGVTVLQNAYAAQARGLSEEVRYRAAHLKPGSYLKNRVKVTVESDGRIVRLSYPVKGDAMLINRDHWSSFSDLIQKIWTEMQAA